MVEKTRVVEKGILMSEIIDGWNKKYEPETLYEAIGNGVQFSNGVFGDITFNGLWGSARFEPQSRMGGNGRHEMFINGRWEDIDNYYV